MFQLVCNQFIVAGMGEVIGIDYNAVLAVLRLYDNDIEDPKDVFEKIVFLSGLQMQDINRRKPKT